MSLLVLLSSCATDARGGVDPFVLQELPWLRAHFDRVCVCGYYGVCEPREDAPERLTCRKPGLAALFAPFRALLCRETWAELAHLRRDRRLTPVRALKLLAFATRGFKMSLWTESLGLDAPDTTIYSQWMSFDGFAAALCKRRHPSVRAIARGHAFDVDIERTPMNPYLMKRFLARWLDGMYVISGLAREQLLQCGDVPAEKLHVVGMGSAGGHAPQRHAPPYFEDGLLHIVSCASVVPVKQLPLLVEALRLYEGPVDWLHIGGGVGEAELRALAGGLPERVRWEITGQLSGARVGQLYAARAFDVFVNTSRKEGEPVSVMEAFRFGVPAIAPAVGGLPGMIDESVGALYAPEGGARAAADALTAFAALPRERVEAMRAAAQRRWDERYRSDRLLPKLFEGGGAA